LILLVNDSEYSRSAGAKPIFSLSCIHLVSPGALLLLLRQLRILLLLLLRAPPPHPIPLFGGRKYQKKSPVASAVAVRHVCVCVGVMEIAAQCKNYTSEV
jgi:hypothetical protein